MLATNYIGVLHYFLYLSDRGCFPDLRSSRKLSSLSIIPKSYSNFILFSLSSSAYPIAIISSLASLFGCNALIFVIVICVPFSKLVLCSDRTEVACINSLGSESKCQMFILSGNIKVPRYFVKRGSFVRSLLEDKREQEILTMTNRQRQGTRMIFILFLTLFKVSGSPKIY